MRALYGITDTGDCWGVTLDTHVMSDLQIVSLETHPSLYMTDSTNCVEELLSAYIDDCLLGGDERFQELTKDMLLKLNSRPGE